MTATGCSPDLVTMRISTHFKILKNNQISRGK